MNTPPTQTKKDGHTWNETKGKGEAFHHLKPDVYEGENNRLF